MEKVRKFNFSYDEIGDDLFLFDAKEKSKGSVEIGEIVLDFNAKKDLVGIELGNASESLSFEDAERIKARLKNIKGCIVRIKENKNLLLIQIVLRTNAEDIKQMLSFPKLVSQSPSLRN